MDSLKPYRIKIISMGDSETGKSCIIKRYCEKRFVGKYLATIGIDYGVTRVNQKNYDLKVNIFDMAGHPIFYEVRNEFYRDTQGAILVYDSSSQQSFNHLDDWIAEMKSELAHPRDFANIVICVCANKSDKRKVVDSDEAKLWADSHGFLFYETSAQSGEGVNEMFQALFDAVLTAVKNGGKKVPIVTQLGYTKEQVETIQRLKQGKTDHEKMGLYQGATKDEINKAYRKLAMLLHPDKSVAPGTEEAFKLLVAARTSLLKAERK